MRKTRRSGRRKIARPPTLPRRRRAKRVAPAAFPDARLRSSLRAALRWRCAPWAAATGRRELRLARRAIAARRKITNRQSGENHELLFPFIDQELSHV